jgi:hypothetical protein
LRFYPIIPKIWSQISSRNTECIINRFFCKHERLFQQWQEIWSLFPLE